MMVATSPETAIATYRELGAVCVEGALDPDRVLAMRAFFDRIAAHHPVTGPLGDHAMIVHEDGNLFLEFLSREYELFRDTIRDSPVAEIVGRIVETEQLIFWRDELLYKEHANGSNGTPWHHGIASIPFKGCQVPTVWIPLGNVTEDNAPLLTIDGTHTRQSSRIAPPTRRARDLEPGYATAPDFDRMIADSELRLRVWTPNAGDAVVFHPYTIHGSGPNRCARGRLAYITRWLGDDALWEPDAYSVIDRGFDPASMLVDQRPSDPWFPVAWSRNRERGKSVSSEFYQ